jgi:hypothetical protein
MRNTWITVVLLPIAGLLAGCGGVTVTIHPQPSAACKGSDMAALPAIPTPPPAGTVAVRVSMINKGDYACTITGVPKVAVGGGSAKPRSLTVTGTGAGDPLTLAPGQQAVTVVASAMSADFKCAAGGDPTRPPVLLVGVPDDLVAMKMADGGDFTECGDAVTVSPWQAF